MSVLPIYNWSQYIDSTWVNIFHIVGFSAFVPWTSTTAFPLRACFVDCWVLSAVSFSISCRTDRENDRDHSQFIHNTWYDIFLFFQITCRLWYSSWTFPNQWNKVLPKLKRITFPPGSCSPAPWRAVCLHLPRFWCPCPLGVQAGWLVPALPKCSKGKKTQFKIQVREHGWHSSEHGRGWKKVLQQIIPSGR